MDDFNYSAMFPVSVDGSEQMKESAIDYIKNKKPGLAFFAWDYPDRSGHTEGWYTDAYFSELTHIDVIINSIVEACAQAGIIDKTLFVITSDHGGHAKTHGQPMISDLETPFLLYGKGIKSGAIQDPLMQYDVASLLADYLRLVKTVAWRGRTPLGVFSSQ